MGFFLYPRIALTDIWQVKFEGEFFQERFRPAPASLDGIILYPRIYR